MKNAFVGDDGFEDVAEAEIVDDSVGPAVCANQEDDDDDGEED